MINRFVSTELMRNGWDADFVRIGRHLVSDFSGEETIK